MVFQFKNWIACFQFAWKYYCSIMLEIYQQSIPFQNDITSVITYFYFMLLLLKSGLSGFIYQLSIAEENLVMYCLNKLSIYTSMGPDRKCSEYIEEVGWCYYKTAFYHLLKGCVQGEGSLIIEKIIAATIVRKIKEVSVGAQGSQLHLSP